MLFKMHMITKLNDYIEEGIRENVIKEKHNEWNQREFILLFDMKEMDLTLLKLIRTFALALALALACCMCRTSNFI